MSGDEPARFARLMERWIGENPPCTGAGWEPYTLSMRIVNWVKWAMHGQPLSEKALQSLAIQVRRLEQRLEYHLLGNHLFANAKALVFAGMFFEGPEADRWLSLGLQILTAELAEQVLADGGHFELSPMYHSIILVDIVDLISLYRCFEQAVPPEWIIEVAAMVTWLRTMSHPDGEIAFFNDAAFGIAPSPSEVFAYVARVVGETERASQSKLTASGFAVLENDFCKLIMDVGEVGPTYIPGHAHADTLSFEASFFGERVFVNSGTSEYGEGPERQRQRSTAAHNTVVVNGQNSSEVWAGFRVARRAMPRDVSIESDRVKASHDGYRRLSPPIDHERSIVLNSSVVISDTVRGTCESEVVYRLAPTVQVELASNTTAHITLQSGKRLSMSMDGDRTWELRDTTWHPRFGVSMPSKMLVGKRSGSDATTTVTIEPIA